MENPSDFGFSDVSATTAVDDLATSNHGGRPPDNDMCVDTPASLERSSSPISVELQPSNKKDRSLVSPTSVLTMDKGDSRQSFPSFRDKLLNSSENNMGSKSLVELDVEVRNEDVHLGGSSTLPKIQFSDRFHDEIDAKLARSIVVRLLGKSIGYKALLNRIHLLWKPKGDFSLIDLDNEYYLVRFANEADFHNVLTGDPWVTYDSYLTVQPWSRYFSTKDDYPSQIVVWVRLPKLPYRYYTKSLFHHITDAIGKVIRVYYNTVKGKRGQFARLAIVVDLEKPLVSGIIIDGRRQDTKYEGLPEICFKCGKYGHAREVCGVQPPANSIVTKDNIQQNPDNLYEPWMQVQNRKRRNNLVRKDFGVANCDRAKDVGSGSRFSALVNAKESVDIMQEVDHLQHDRRVEHSLTIKYGTPIVNVHPLDVSDMVSKEVNGDIPGGNMVVQISEGRATLKKQPVENICTINEEDTRSQDLPAQVASQGKVVTAKSSLNAGKYVVVQVLEPESNSVPQTVKGRALPNSLFKPRRFQTELKRELDLVLSQEESLWFQKARSQWVDKGDRNTTFFHMSATVRNRHNHIHMLRLDDGSWCDDQELLKPHAIGFFHNLFTSEQSHPRIWLQILERGTGPVYHPSYPPDIRDQIAVVQPPRNWIGPDTHGWRWTGNRQFTTSSAYSYLSDLDMSTKDPIWKKVWALPIPQRVKTFLWVTLHNRNLTNAERFRRHLTSSTDCDICEASTEDMDHVLRHCNAARSHWCRVLLPDLLEEFMITPFDVWLSVVLSSDPTSREDILARGNRLLDEYVQVSNSRPCHYVSTAIPDQLWSHPAPGWVKGNVDATVHTGNVSRFGIKKEERGSREEKNEDERKRNFFIQFA
ncbi:hypothetical protein GQ457_16G013400 [Hibiscus cannabinus]